MRVFFSIILVHPKSATCAFLRRKHRDLKEEERML